MKKILITTLIALVGILTNGKPSDAAPLAPAWATPPWHASNKSFRSIEVALDRKFKLQKAEQNDVADAYQASRADPSNVTKAFTAAYVQYWYMSTTIGLNDPYLRGILHEMNKMNPGASEYARIGFLIATGSDPLEIWVPKLGYQLLEVAPSDNTVILALLIAIQRCPAFPFDHGRLKHYANLSASAHPGTSATYLLLGELYNDFYFDDRKPREGHQAIFYYKKYIASAGLHKEQVVFANQRIAATEDFLKNPPKPDEVIDLTKPPYVK